MRQEWHHFQFPGPEIGQSVDSGSVDLDRWRSLPRAQTPPWPDQETVDDVMKVLNVVPPIVALASYIP